MPGQLNLSLLHEEVNCFTSNIIDLFNLVSLAEMWSNGV